MGSLRWYKRADSIFYGTVAGARYPRLFSKVTGQIERLARSECDMEPPNEPLAARSAQRA
ncbi:hypothetical protein [Gorillibacterium timonense]|uniref:hypothetical protein n=1 Tax=Gorillibacterium timonense TaxID=1689269 RepID=UPI0011DE522D|nr:hypothetical protein [Gorillibacterium timonense]